MEFAVSNGHVYKTIVVNHLNGRVVYIEQGKGMNALESFWKEIKEKCITIKAVSNSLSGAIIPHSCRILYKRLWSLTIFM